MNIRIPGIDNAIKHLRPNATFELSNKCFTKWNCPYGSNPPTWEEILDQLNKDIETYNKNLYVINRQKEYGSWQEQLNVLYDDIKSGNLENGKWIQMIDSVKSKYPKPD